MNEQLVQISPVSVSQKGFGCKAYALGLSSAASMKMLGPRLMLLILSILTRNVVGEYGERITIEDQKQIGELMCAYGKKKRVSFVMIVTQNCGGVMYCNKVIKDRWPITLLEWRGSYSFTPFALFDRVRSNC